MTIKSAITNVSGSYGLPKRWQVVKFEENLFPLSKNFIQEPSLKSNIILKWYIHNSHRNFVHMRSVETHYDPSNKSVMIKRTNDTRLPVGEEEIILNANTPNEGIFKQFWRYIKKGVRNFFELFSAPPINSAAPPRHADFGLPPYG